MFQMLSIFFCLNINLRSGSKIKKLLFLGENYNIENAKNFKESLLKIVSPLFRAHEILVINIWQKRIYLEFI